MHKQNLSRQSIIYLLIAFSFLLFCWPATFSRAETKIIIADNGAGKKLIEDTLPAVALAAAGDIDYIELNVMMTSDNQPVIFGNLTLDRISDVAELFPDRSREDGSYYVIDFSLQEIRQIRLKNVPAENDIALSLAIPTLRETLSLIRRLESVLNKEIGIILEIKYPWFYSDADKDISSASLDSLAEYANRMGLGHKTGIEFEYEKSGLIPTAAWKKLAKGVPWQEGETLSIAIGQGFDLVTPLQVAQMTAALANGGILYKPLLIEKIIDPEGQYIKEFEPAVDVELIGMDKYLALIRDGLIGAVNDKHGTGKAARLKDITVAGKTGTAQVVTMEKFKETAEEDVKYKHRDHAWFTSFAPAENPEIAVTVLVEHGGHGGSAAAPVAKKILERYFAKKIEAEIENVQADPAGLQ